MRFLINSVVNRGAFIAVVLLFIGLNTTTYAQSTVHLIGVKSGVTIAGMNTHPDHELKEITSFGGYGFEYTYYHTLWSNIKLFGVQVGMYKDYNGYIDYNGENRFETISFPLISQFHYDFSKMRILLNAGAYGGVRQNMRYADGRSFDPEDNRVDLGFVAGGGVAFIFSPFEFHLEGNWFYSLTYMHSPKKFDEIGHVFTHPKRMVISASIHLQLGGRKNEKN